MTTVPKVITTSLRDLKTASDPFSRLSSIMDACSYLNALLSRKMARTITPTPILASGLDMVLEVLWTFQFTSDQRMQFLEELMNYPDIVRILENPASFFLLKLRLDGKLYHDYAKSLLNDVNVAKTERIPTRMQVEEENDGS